MANQFPNVKYLKLLFPLDTTLYINCLKTIFSVDNSIENKRCYWPKLIHFSTELVYPQLDYIWDNNQLYNWLIQNTDLKYHKCPFYVHCFLSNISIWF
jgi:hypothetical protein